ncbi:MAG TPA: glycosyltransferase [Solirubrobacteraceae bacterium]|nr:glycosyltransferase [Solirubrobacteraceae bacterium]
MRVLLSTWGGRGDVEPMVGLAAKLQARGAEVRVCAPPDEDFERRLADVGVALTPIGPSARMLTRMKPGTASIPDTAKAIIAGQFETMPAAAEGCDVVVATGALPAAAGALAVAEKLGIPAISVTFQQLTLPSPTRRPLAYPGRPLPEGATIEEQWAFDRESIELLFGEALNANRTANGMEPVDDVRAYVVTDRPWVASDPVLDPWTGDPALGVVQTGAWIDPDPRPLPPDLLAFLDAGTPPVYVGFGSMAMHGSEDPAEEAIAAIRAHGRRAVLMSGWAELAPEEAADDVFVLPEVSHQALFPRCATVVHHGGAGTTTAATRAGTPQIVVPQAADQPYWASRAAELGVGVAHDGPVPTSSSLADALAVTLAPETRSRATAVGGMVRLDGTAEAARLILDGAAASRS